MHFCFSSFINWVKVYSIRAFTYYLDDKSEKSKLFFKWKYGQFFAFNFLKGFFEKAFWNGKLINSANIKSFIALIFTHLNCGQMSKDKKVEVV